jgi:hypothetical protein
VLVSDFFTAYDSIECPQQKCLIHLIRDMNEDVKANPFDAELKGIVQAFTTVVRPIIETVDRYGLTKSRLQKHKITAMGSLRRLPANGSRPRRRRNTRSASRSTAIACSHFWTMMVSRGTTTMLSTRLKYSPDIGGLLTGVSQKNR